MYFYYAGADLNPGLRRNVKIENFVTLVCHFEQTTEKEDFAVVDVETMAASGSRDCAILLNRKPATLINIELPHIVESAVSVAQSSKEV